jgi:hypothetical protein
MTQALYAHMNNKTIKKFFKQIYGKIQMKENTPSESVKVIMHL